VRKILAIIVTATITLEANAGSNGVYAGPNYTTGDTPSEHSIFAAATNPAYAALPVFEYDAWRMNILPTFWNRHELGEVDNFIDDLDELIDLLDDPSSIDEPVQDVLDRFNEVLVKMGEDGYTRNNVGLTAPLMPLYFRSESLNATFFAEFSYGATVGMSILDDELTFDIDTLFNTNTSAYLKSGLEARLSGGASKKIFAFGNQNKKLDVYAGVKLNLVRMELSKQIIALQQLNGESIEDVIVDSYDQNLNASTNFSVDIGVMVDADRYRAGLSITDLNSPAYSYGAIGVACDGFPEDSIERSNCDTAQYFVEVLGEVVGHEEHEQKALATLDGVYFLTKKWSVSGSMELAAYDDVVGQQNQWMTLATSYQSEHRFWPAIRAGYQKNLAGSALTSFNLGFTFFQRLTMDGSWGLESVDVDDVQVPRTFGFSIGLNQKF